ncbi:MAG: type II secretion system secretin GspD [Thermodesulfobacteriota bacterium]
MIKRFHARKEVLMACLLLFFWFQSPAMGQEPGEKGKTPEKSMRAKQADNLELLKEKRRGRPAPYTIQSPAADTRARIGEAESPDPTVEPPMGAVQPPTTMTRPPMGAVQPPAAAVQQEISLPKEGPQQGDHITMNFKDVDLHVLVKFMSDITGKNFVIDPNLKGTMTILSPEKITPEEAYRVFLSVLDVHGFAAVPSGKVVKIIQALDAKSKGVETLVRDSLRSAEDRIVTQLVPLKHGDAVEFAKFLTPLIPKSGLAVPYPDTNTLILIDSQSNIQRLTGIVRELDVPDARGRVHIFELENANAKKLAAKLVQLYQPKRSLASSPGQAAGTADAVKIIPEERTNTLIVMASATQVADIRQMLDQLDKKLGKRAGNIRILPLRYAVAEDLAKVLTEIPGKSKAKGVEDKEGAAKAPALSKDVQIYPDKATNSLVILAEPDEYDVLEEIIRQLDVPRTMVYVEALIMEVSATKSLDLGVEWRAGDSFHGGYSVGSKGGVVLGGTPGASDVDALATGAIPDAFSVGVVGKAIRLGSLVFPSFGAFVRAVRSDSDFNIISTPQILTMDNAEATIEVGQNIPFVTRVDQPAQVTERAIQTFEYRDVGVTLKVTPHISTGRTVRLKVEQGIKSIVSSTALGGTVLAPTTSYRKAKTEITVNDGETAVIGGLMENRMDRQKTQTPCLGGIPGLGWLFKSTSDHDEKTNLLVFLAPRIVESPEEAGKLYGRKKEDIDRFWEEAVKKREKEKVRGMLLE